ncbi:hypothetical protein T4B_11478 [Trichinella pseudospiralis]|uniref:Uncharacterized protein n=1 Tax=Trichinella pseudospiralis TaxID=6337 RepID=A0A0V1GLC3_TRIPS|nr:hypothetical protein T4B_11478 [Trichinella pseudospiralis]KRY99023.1 hypothetical protein T4C_6513 [Trichinella pseudospiralis]
MGNNEIKSMRVFRTLLVDGQNGYQSMGNNERNLMRVFRAFLV